MCPGRAYSQAAGGALDSSPRTGCRIRQRQAGLRAEAAPAQISLDDSTATPAVAVGANYSCRLRDEQWRDTAKYFQIRSTSSSRVIVKHV